MAKEKVARPITTAKAICTSTIMAKEGREGKVVVVAAAARGKVEREERAARRAVVQAAKEERAAKRVEVTLLSQVTWRQLRVPRKIQHCIRRKLL